MLAVTVEATCAAANRAFFGVLKMHRPSVRGAPLLRDGVAWRVCDSDLVDLLPSERRRTRRVGGHGSEPDVLARHQEHRALLFIREGAARKQCAGCGEPRGADELDDAVLGPGRGAMTPAVEHQLV